MREAIDFVELKATGQLPSPKGVALRVMQLCQDENLSLKELAQTIQGDPALAGRIIKIANYVNPNRSRPIASVTTDTLILIGIHAVRQVVLGLSLIGNYREGRCKLFDYEQFWSQSIAMGSAAHAIASILRVAAPAEMFNCGLMSGIGQLALVTVRPDQYCEMLAGLQDASANALIEAQHAQFGMTQRDLMLFMLQDWGIPKLFIDALYYHEDPLASGYAENSRPLKITYTLQLASLIARAVMQENPDDNLLSRIKAFSALLDINPEHLDEIAELTRMEWQDWCDMLDVRVTRKAETPQPTNHVDDSKIETGPSVQPDPAAEPLPVASNPLRILIASANELQCNMLKKALLPTGHELHFVDNGKKVLETFSRINPQVVIVDWLVPELDGLAVCRALRLDPTGEKIYCMIVNQFEDERRKIDAYEAGADFVLHTPISPKLLNAQLTIAQRYARIHGNQ